MLTHFAAIPVAKSTYPDHLLTRASHASFNTEAKRFGRMRTKGDEAESTRCLDAKEMIQTGKKVATVVRDSGISWGTADRIKLPIEAKDEDELANILSPSCSRADRRTAIT